MRRPLEQSRMVRSRLSTVQNCLLVAVYGLLVWTLLPARAGAPFPEPTVVCSIIISGPPSAPKHSSWVPSLVHVQCSNRHPDQNITIQVGQRLWPYLAAPSLCGASNSTGGLPTAGVCPVYSGASTNDHQSPPAYGETPSDSSPLPDNNITLGDGVNGMKSSDGSAHTWGLTFPDHIEHLLLWDSILEGPPLSELPLVYCKKCTYVTVSNVVVSNLRGSASVSTPDCSYASSLGALLFDGVRGADVDRLTCTNVRNASDFACLWITLELADDEHFMNSSVVRISDSVFLDNAVEVGCAENNMSYYGSSDNLGFGAIVIFGPYSGVADISSYLGTLEFSNVSAIGNTGGFGAALAVLTDVGQIDARAMHLGRINISRSTLSNNTARKHGGAVYIGKLDNSLELHVMQASHIDGNTAVDIGGNGGAFKVEAVIGQLVVRDSSSVSANTATKGSGGAFYLAHGIGSGGSIAITAGSSVSFNQAAGKSGGAVHIELEGDNVAQPCNGTCGIIIISDNSHVINNSASNHGGAFSVRVPVGQFLVVNSSSMNSNNAGGPSTTDHDINLFGWGGAIYIGRRDLDAPDNITLGNLTLSNNASISFNGAAVQGGAIYSSNITGAITIERGSRMDDNSVINMQYASYGGGISVMGDLPYLFVRDGSSLSGNVVDASTSSQYGNPLPGGAVFVGGSLGSLVVTGYSNVSRNTATDGGSAIAVGMGYQTEPLTTDNLKYGMVEVSNHSCICENVATGDGSRYGAIVYRRSRISNFLVTGSSAVSGNVVYGGDGYGGAVSSEGGFDNFTVSGASAMSNNTGGNGGVLHVSNVRNIQGATNELLSVVALKICDGSNMDWNRANTRGGVFYIEGPVGSVNISDSSISSNFALNEGGALQLRALFTTMTISNSRIYNNSVDFGPGGFMSVSAIFDPTNPDTDDKMYPASGPFYFNISNSNISANIAVKDGGAINMRVQSWKPTVINSTSRLQAQQQRILYINMYNSTMDHNCALYGAGGAMAFITQMPSLIDEKRLASVMFGLRVQITNSTLNANKAGDDSKQLLTIQDVSPLQGYGGAIFAWAIFYPMHGDGSHLNGSAAEYSFPEDRAECGAVEPNLVPGVPAFATTSCWPSGSQACGLMLDGVQVYDNQAAGANGGGLSTANCAVKILDSYFRNNTATRGGGGVAFIDQNVPQYVAFAAGNLTFAGSSLPGQWSQSQPPPPMNDTDSSWRPDLDSLDWSARLPMSSSLGEAGGWAPSSADVFQNIDMSKPLQHPWLFLKRVTFQQNSASDGAGVYLEVNMTSAAISECILERNQAKNDGGGIMLIGNSDNARVIAAMRDTNFTNNYAGDSGGGLTLRLTQSRAAALISSSNFKSNKAIRGGAIYNSGIRGTSFLCWGCDFEDNSANSGGAVNLDYVIEDEVVVMQDAMNTTQPPPPPPPPPPPSPPRPPRPPPPPPPAGNISAFNPVTAIVHFLACRMLDNNALLSGGAVYLAASKQNVLAVLERSSLWLNSASALGGGVYLNASNGCTLRVSASRISNNSAPQGGGAYATTKCGGQLAIGNGSYWSGNVAGLYGGAIMVDSQDAIAVSNTTNITDSYRISIANAPAACQKLSLDLSNSTVVSNSALQGGGVYVSQQTVVVVRGTALASNTAWEFGGALTAISCNLLNVLNSSIVGNIAAFSGGGIYADKCAVFVVEMGQLSWNMAAAGGAVHVAGVKSYMAEDGSNNVTRRLLQAGTLTSGSSGSRYTITSVNPVAIFSRVDLSRNIALGYSGLSASSSLSAVVTSTSANTYQVYSGHGGAIFISGQVGVAVSNSSAGPENTANVGTVLATTQVCSSIVPTSSPTSKSVSEQFANNLAVSSWSDAITALSLAANVQCSPLVVRASKLLWSVASSTPSNVSQIAWASVVQAWQQQQMVQSSGNLPLIWLQDLNASSLIANCPGNADLSETRGIIQIVRQLVPNIDRSGLIPALQACGDYHLYANDTQQAPIALAVPATHMRVISFDGVILIPNTIDSVETASGGNTGGVLSGNRPEIAYSSSPAESSNNKSPTFRGEEIRAMVVAPNAYFNISVQLYDGLGQPVVVDTPTFTVSLEVLPRDSGLLAAAKSDHFAQLRINDAVLITEVKTRKGVVSWTNLGIWGWPGQYVLSASAKIDGDDSTINAALPQIENLAINIELLPCELGHELTLAGNTDSYSCTVCRRDQVGLWRDLRAPLSELLNSSMSPTEILETISENNSYLVNGLVDDTLTCPSCCQVCPTNGICPGGAILIPGPGFWHSAPSSPRMHRCPQPSSCGKKASPMDDEVDQVWGHELDLRFNANSTSSNGTNVTNAASLDNLYNMGSLRNDNRSLLLAACQQWWYRTFPPSRDSVLEQLFNISRQQVQNPPCYLYHDTALGGEAGDGGSSYMQLQCATGFTGHVCATCEPGYSLTVDFSCMRCPSLARSISVGLLAFWGTVALILFTVFSNLSQTRAEAMEAEELSSLDLLKTLITHIQYFIIITKLGINYPTVITKYQSVLGALTGTENFIAYSPSCLFSGLSSAGQAATQIAFGLAAPCVATFICLVAWTIRYLAANQSMLRRMKGGRLNPSDTIRELIAAQEPPELPNSISREGPITPRHSKTKKAGKGRGLTPAGSTTQGGGFGGMVPSAAQLPLASSRVVSMPSSPDGGGPQGALTTVGCIMAPGTRPFTTTVTASQPLPALPPSAAAAGTDSRLKSTPGAKSTAYLVASSSAQSAAAHNEGATVSIMMDRTAQNAGPSGSRPVHSRPDNGGTDNDGRPSVTLDDQLLKRQQPEAAQQPSAVESRGDAGTSLVPSTQLHPMGFMGAGHGPRFTSEPAYSAAAVYPLTPVPSYPGAPLGAAPFPSIPPLTAGAGHIPSDKDHWDHTPFAAGPPVDHSDDPHSTSDSHTAQHGPIQFWARRFANPLRLLVFADQAVSLLQQLEVVIIVASFILYPSLCQISLSIFACYKLDTGSGPFHENQQATWTHGYWIRDMEQECYAGMHRSVYVPIGIAAVLLFCFCPPVVYFFLTFKSRHEFNDRRIRIQYGFLYQQYKLEFYWWASMRQLQVLALVAVEVFGRALPVLQQALMLLSVLIIIAAINTSAAPERFPELMILEFLSMCVLSLTLTLGLYFVGDSVDDQLSNAASTTVGVIILLINALFIVGVLVFSARQSAQQARQVRRVISSSWNSLVTNVSRALSKVERRYSSISSSRRSNASKNLRESGRMSKRRSSSHG